MKQGFVPVGDLTAVIGANDAGKSRLVRTFASALGSATDPDGGHVAFFARHSDDEARALLWVLEDWNDSFVGSFTRANIVPSTLAEVRGLHSESDFPGWTEIVRELEDSRLFAFVPADLGTRPGWEVYWCLPWTEKSARAARFAEADVQPPSDTAPGRTGRLLDQGWPMLRADDGGPKPIVRLGVAPIWWLPIPLFVPTTENLLVETATDAITGLLGYLEWPENEGKWLLGQADTDLIDQLLVDVVRDALKLGGYFKPAGDSWISQPGPNTLELKPVVAEAAEAMELIATRLAPEIVRDRYRLTVRVSPRSVLTDEAPIQYALEPVTPDQNDIGPFKTEDAADGLRIWIELAFLQAAESVRRHAATLHWFLDQQLNLIDSMYHDLKEVIDEGREPPEEHLIGDAENDDFAWPHRDGGNSSQRRNS